jgi:hypothetical protein
MTNAVRSPFYSARIVSACVAILLALCSSQIAKAQTGHNLNFPGAYSQDLGDASNGVNSGPSAVVFGNRIFNALMRHYSYDPQKFCMEGYYSPQYYWTCNDNAAYPIDGQPQATVWNGYLYVAYALAGSHQLVIARSSDGATFNYYEPAGIAVAPGPAIAVFNNQLYVAYQQNASSHYLGIARSSDGINFSNQLYTQFRIGHSPAMVKYGTKLVIANFCQCDSHYLDIYNSTDGVNFTFTENTSQTLSNISTPSLAVYGNALLLAYVHNGTNDIYTSVAYDGHTFAAPNRQSALTFSLGGASLVVFNNQIWIFFESERALSSDPNSGPYQIYYGIANGLT